MITPVLINHPRLTASQRKNDFLLYSTFAILLFGMKLWLINGFGNITPFWDQWDGEAAFLYKPFRDGTLSLSALLAPHNEHRIFTTRLVALLLLTINKTWNPLLQMVVNAAIHIAAISFCTSLLVKVVGRRWLPAILVFTFVLFAVPYAWENSLAGFQTQFYFVFLFSVATLWFTVMYEPLTKKWWLGVFYGLLSFLSLASGIFVLGCSAAIGVIMYIAGQRRNGRQLIAILILGMLFAVGAYLTPSLEQHAQFKAHSLSEFFKAIKGISGWPISQSWLAAILRNLPAIAFIIFFLRKYRASSDRGWFLVVLIGWMLTQSISIAYGRAAFPLASRYLDLFAIGVLVNFFCLLNLIDNAMNSRPDLARVFAFIWVTIIFLSLGRYTARSLPEELLQKKESSLRQEVNTRNFLSTGDSVYLYNKPLLDIPYPHPDRLAMLLQTEGIKNILPGSLRGTSKPVSSVSKPVNAFITNGYYFTTPKRADSIWGSWNAQGDLGKGELDMNFDTPLNGDVEIPVAGYPLNSGMKIEIEQNGERTDVSIAANPKEEWGIARGRVKSGSFTVHVTDASDKYWVALGQPTVKVNGKLDHLTSRLLSGYYLLLVLGVSLLLFIIIRNILQPVDKTLKETY